MCSCWSLLTATAKQDYVLKVSDILVGNSPQNTLKCMAELIYSQNIIHRFNEDTEGKKDIRFVNSYCMKRDSSVYIQK